MRRLTIITMQLQTPGGIERFISTLATMLSDQYEVELVVNYGSSSVPTAFPLPKNIKLTYLSPNQPAAVSLKTLLTHPAKWLRIPAELVRRHKINTTRNKVFHNFFHNLSADAIITDRALYSSLVAKYYHGPAKKIATDHNFHQNSHKYIAELLSSIKSFDYLVVATDELRDFYATRTQTKCLTIPNPVPFIPTEKSTLTTNNLISVGRLVPEKDFSLLISAMKFVHDQNPDIHLTIVGDGTEKPALVSQIKTLGLMDTITLTGWLPQPKIADLYLKSSLYISTSKTEAFGLTLTEAMSYGLPVLALARASGARAQITQDTGLLLQNSTPEAVASAILSLISSPATLRSYQSRINQAITKYSAPTIQKSWQKLLS